MNGAKFGSSWPAKYRYLPKFDIEGRLKSKRRHSSLRVSEVARKRYINFRNEFPQRVAESLSFTLLTLFVIQLKSNCNQRAWNTFRASMWAANLCEISGIGQIFRRCHILFFCYLRRARRGYAKVRKLNKPPRPLSMKVQNKIRLD